MFANLVHFDRTWGHRNDPAGFQEGLRGLDRALPEFGQLLREDDVFFLTADHGNDPTTPPFDHSRARAPVGS